MVKPAPPQLKDCFTQGQRLRTHQTENQFPLAHLRKQAPGSACTDCRLTTRFTTAEHQQGQRSEPAATRDDGTNKLPL